MFNCTLNKYFVDRLGIQITDIIYEVISDEDLLYEEYKSLMLGTKPLKYNFEGFACVDDLKDYNDIFTKRCYNITDVEAITISY